MVYERKRVKGGGLGTVESKEASARGLVEALVRLDMALQPPTCGMLSTLLKGHWSHMTRSDLCIEKRQECRNISPLLAELELETATS